MASQYNVPTEIMTSIKLAKFANQTAKRIKNSDGKIPTNSQIGDLVEKSIEQFNDIIEGSVCNTCVGDLPECPCCAIDEIADRFAEELDINIAYLNYLRDDKEFDNMSVKDQDNAYTLYILKQHAFISTDILNKRDDILSNPDYGIKSISNRGEIIHVELESMENNHYPESGVISYIADVLKQELNAPELSSVESGGQPDQGIDFAYYGW